MFGLDPSEDPDDPFEGGDSDDVAEWLDEMEFEVFAGDDGELHFGEAYDVEDYPFG